MIYHRLINRFLSKNNYFFVREISRRVQAMDKIYFRLPEGSEQFQVTFRFKYEVLNVDRTFNFSRKLSETVGSFVERIKCNLDKVLGRKKARKNKKLEEAGSETITENIDVSIKVNSALVDEAEVCQDVFFSNKEVQFFILGRNYNVIVNAPWVVALSLPNSIMVGFPLYPNKIELLFGVVEKSIFQWYKSNKSKPGWSEVGTGLIYIPEMADIDCKIMLKCVPSDGTQTGPELEVESSSVVQAGPGVCPFEDRHLLTADRVGDNGFRVVCYNILADVYAVTETAKTQLFPYCPSHALLLDYRKQLYLKEILGYKADLLCLQEVDTKVFENDLLFVLNRSGYDGKFCRKSGSMSEGVAIFYLTDKFRLVDSKRVILGEEVSKNAIFAGIWDKIKSNTSVANRLQEKGTAVQILILESVKNIGEKIIVGNTHLYFSPDADHIRLLQGCLTIRLLEKTVAEIKMKYPEDKISVLLCGDLNSTPDCGIYQLVTTKNISKDHKDWTSNEEEIVNGFDLNQPFNMESAYGAPPFTNYTEGFVGCLDYIFYQTDRLSLKQVVPIPNEEVLKVFTAIPSVVHPSDHIALVADLEWK